MTKTICGVDTSKQYLDARIVPGEAFARFANDATGIARLAAFCAEHKPKMVVRVALAHKLLVRLNAKAREARAQFANAT